MLASRGGQEEDLRDRVVMCAEQRFFAGIFAITSSSTGGVDTEQERRWHSYNQKRTIHGLLYPQTTIVFAATTQKTVTSARKRNGGANLSSLNQLRPHRPLGLWPDGFKKTFHVEEPLASHRTTENLVSCKSGNTATLGKTCSPRKPVNPKLPQRNLWPKMTRPGSVENRCPARGSLPTSRLVGTDPRIPI